MPSRPKTILDSALLGATLLGIIAFLIGYIGPIIFMPESNQGPLLGIFITGPLGVVVGAIIGAVVGCRRQRRGD
jgi:hypothetical protein